MSVTNYRKMNFTVFLFLIFINSKIVYAGGNDIENIDPAINAVFSGPFKWDGEKGEKFRVVVMLSEIYLSMYVQKIIYGSENCCAQIVSNRQIDFKKITGNQQIYNIENFVWLEFDKIQFKGDSEVYTVELW